MVVSPGLKVDLERELNSGENNDRTISGKKGLQTEQSIKSN